ncbi:MAG: hypothetical protein ABI862_20605 [Ilumatobacteraceae bacterium]
MAALVVTAVSCGDDSTDSTVADNGPLSAILGGNDSPAESRRKELAVQESMAQCMKDAGWEYKPVDFSAQFNTPGGEDQQLSPKEFGEKHFYGTVYYYELYELPNLGTDENGVPATVPGQSFVDPNQDYINSLSSDEQSKYNADLYGAPQEAPVIESGEGGVQEAVAVPIEQQGCSGKAQQEVYGDQPFNNPEFGKRFEELQQQLQNDPRVNDAEIAWSDCVYDINPDFDFGTSQDVYQYMQGLMSEAKGQKTLPVDPETHQPIGDYDQNAGYSSTVDSDGNEIAYVGTPKAIKSDRLEELRVIEKDLWQADQKCQKKVGLADIRKDVEQELADTLLQEFPELQKNES